MMVKFKYDVNPGLSRYPASVYSPASNDCPPHCFLKTTKAYTICRFKRRAPMQCYANPTISIHNVRLSAHSLLTFVTLSCPSEWSAAFSCFSLGPPTHTHGDTNLLPLFRRAILTLLLVLPKLLDVLFNSLVDTALQLRTIAERE